MSEPIYLETSRTWSYAVAVEAFLDRAAGRPVRQPSRARELWSPRWFVRYAAWHALVHAWDIEDRRLD